MEKTAFVLLLCIKRIENYFCAALRHRLNRRSSGLYLKISVVSLSGGGVLIGGPTAPNTWNPAAETGTGWKTAIRFQSLARLHSKCSKSKEHCRMAAMLADGHAAPELFPSGRSARGTIVFQATPHDRSTKTNRNLRCRQIVKSEQPLYTRIDRSRTVGFLHNNEDLCT